MRHWRQFETYERAYRIAGAAKSDLRQAKIAEKIVMVKELAQIGPKLKESRDNKKSS